MLALRLGAYQGVVQARALEERERENGGSNVRPAGRTAQPATKTSDTVALAMLEADGWLERGG